MENVTQPWQIVFLCGLFVLFCAAAWWWLRGGVNHSGEIMSRGEQNAPRDLPSSLETDGRQTAPQTDRPPIGPQELLTLYRLMRSAGITREDARPVLKAVGLPLNNNLWTLAKPPEDAALTPIALRPTKAAFYEDDPDLVYQPPN